MNPKKVLTTAGLIVALGGVVANTTAFSVKYKELKQDYVDVRNELEEVNGQTRSELKALINQTKQGLTDWTSENLKELRDSIAALSEDVSVAVAALEGVDAQNLSNLTQKINALETQLKGVDEDLEEAISDLEDEIDVLGDEFTENSIKVSNKIGDLQMSLEELILEMEENKTELAGLIDDNTDLIDVLREDLDNVMSNYATKVELQEESAKLQEMINFNAFNIWQIKMQLEMFNGQFARKMKAYFNGKLTEVYEEFPGKVCGLVCGYSISEYAPNTIADLLSDLITPLDDAGVSFDGDDDFDNKDVREFVSDNLAAYIGLYDIRAAVYPYSYLPYNYGVTENVWANVVAPLWQEGTTLITLGSNWWEAGEYFKEYKNKIDNLLCDLELKKEILKKVESIWELPHLDDVATGTATENYEEGYKWVKSYFINELLDETAFNGYININSVRDFVATPVEEQNEAYDEAIDLLDAYEESTKKFDTMVDNLETLYAFNKTTYVSDFGPDEVDYTEVKSLANAEAKHATYLDAAESATGKNTLEDYLEATIYKEVDGEYEVASVTEVDAAVAELCNDFDIISKKSHRFIDIIAAYEYLEGDALSTKELLSSLSHLNDDTESTEYTDWLAVNKTYVDSYKDGSDADSFGFDVFDSYISEADEEKTAIEDPDDVDTVTAYILAKMGANDIRMKNFNNVYNTKLSYEDLIEEYTYEINGAKSIKAFVDALDDLVTVENFLDATSDSDVEADIKDASDTFEADVTAIKDLAGTQKELEYEIDALLDKAGNDLSASVLSDEKNYMEDVIDATFAHYTYVDATGDGALLTVEDGDEERPIKYADKSYTEFFDETVTTDYDDVIAADIDKIAEVQGDLDSYNNYVNTTHNTSFNSWLAQGHNNATYALKPEGRADGQNDGYDITQKQAYIDRFDAAFEAAQWVDPTGCDVTLIDVPTVSGDFATVMSDLDAYVNGETGSISAQQTDVATMKSTLNSTLQTLFADMTTEFNNLEAAYVAQLKTLYSNQISNLLVKIKEEVNAEEPLYTISGEAMTSLENMVEKAVTDMTADIVNTSAGVVEVFKYWFGLIAQTVMTETSDDADAITTLNSYRADYPEIV